VAEEHEHPLRALLAKFWAPVPWMLEVAVVLELALGEPVEALIFAALLVFNGVVGFAQERRAEGALALLRSRLQVRTRVRRDGTWQSVAAEALVPGDLVHLQMGDLVPADARLSDGELDVDQSALTGESLTVHLVAGGLAYAGATVVRGQASGAVTATGASTYFGKTAELVRSARSPSHLEQVIMGIVRYLVGVDVLLVVALFVYALVTGFPLEQVLPFSLILLIASVPVALPATFTLATALGALDLAGHGLLVTRLSAIEEAAAMDVLCTDKTGTITENRLSVSTLRPQPPYDETTLLRYAALASDEAGSDPLDLAILEAAHQRGIELGARLRFVPFEPSTKRAEAYLSAPAGVRRVAKGAPDWVAKLVAAPGPNWESDVTALAGTGARVLGVVVGPEAGPLEPVGVFALDDTVRPDSTALVARLHQLGVRVVMVTGDALATGRAVAERVGIGTRACLADRLRTGAAASTDDCDLFAEVLPEDKFHLVRGLQKTGHVVGMTGDGVNDAPALRQAEVGVAVSSATDVAKAAASVVLTTPGLADVVAGVETSRRIYQRMLTYTLNKIIKTFQIALFLSVGLLVTGQFVTTPRLVVLLLFANDFVTMSIATDNVSFSLRPDRWPVRGLVMSALLLAIPLLLVSFGVFWAGLAWLHLDPNQLHTLVFVWLVFSGQATVYLVRERGRFWSSMPSRALAISSAADLLVVSALALLGWLMTPIGAAEIVAMFLLALLFLLGTDALKVRVLRREGLA
jgi:H+-transporting ATPase